MITCTCIDKFKDKNNKIILYRILYRLADSNKCSIDIMPEELKRRIISGEINVDNLILTKDNRLISKDKASTNNKAQEVWIALEGEIDGRILLETPNGTIKEMTWSELNIKINNGAISIRKDINKKVIDKNLVSILNEITEESVLKFFSYAKKLASTKKNKIEAYNIICRHNLNFALSSDSKAVSFVKTFNKLQKQLTDSGFHPTDMNSSILDSCDMDDMVSATALIVHLGYNDYITIQKNPDSLDKILTQNEITAKNKKLVYNILTMIIHSRENVMKQL